MLVQSISNPPLPPPLQKHQPPPSTTLITPFPPAASSIIASHSHPNLEIPRMDTFLPSSYHHSNYEGRHQNPHAQQYQLATRLEQSRRSRTRTRSPERPAAGLPSGADTSGSYANLRGGVVKTVDTDLTRYQNTSSFRGTTPPQRLRYIYRPDQEVPKDYLASDGRHRTWEEVPYDAKYKPKSYRDRNGIEWVPVLSREASEHDWSSWESRERRRVAGWERREREYMDHHGGMHSPEWEETHQSIHPSFLRYRNRDGSSALLTPSGNRSMTLLDSRIPWHDREYHHVGRDPIANYQTIFGGLEAEQERQRILSAEEAAREKEYHKHLRKEKRDWEHARRKEEKMMLKYDLELQKLDAKKAQQIADEGQLKVVKRIVHHADGRDEVKFVKVRVGGKQQQQQHHSSSHHGHHHHHDRHRSTSPRIAAVKPVHAPWGSSVAAHRNASRIATAERNLGHSLTPNAQHALSILNAAERRALGIGGGGAMQKRGTSNSRPGTASGGWLNPATREESRRRATRSRSGSRSRSRSRSGSSRSSRSRSTSSSRRRQQRRRDREIKHALKEEAKRKREHAKKNSAGIQAGTGDLPLSADHPRSSDLEAYLLQQEKDRQKLAVDRLGATLNSLDKLSLGGVGAPTRQQIQAAKAAAAAGGRRRSRSVSSASSSDRSGSSSSSGFSSRSNSRSRSRSSSRSSRSSPRRRHHSRRSKKHSRSRSNSSSSSSRSRSRSRSGSRSSSSSSSSSSRSSRSSHRHHHSKKHHQHSDARKRDWTRRESFESMDKRIRSHTEEKWLREWRKRYDKAGSDRQKRALKQEKKDWLARRAMQHTLVQTANQPQVNDKYLIRSNSTPTTTIGGIEVGTIASPDGSSPAVSQQSSHGILLDQYGTPISQYGTVYPKPSGNLLQQASVLEQYAAASAHSAKLLEETRDNVERSTKGIENIIDGLRNGYATKGMDLTEAQQNQQALHISLRAAIRAREDRRKKNEAMQRANRNVLDELRRQEAVIMDRSKAVEENIALSAYEKAMKGQQLRLAQQQQQIAIQQALAAQAARAADGESEEAMMKRLNGRRPKSQVNLALGLDNQAQVDPYWFEKKDVTFTANMIEYNNGLKSSLAQNGVDF